MELAVLRGEPHFAKGPRWEEPNEEHVCSPFEHEEQEKANWQQSLHAAIGSLLRAMEDRREELDRMRGMDRRLAQLEVQVRELSKAGSFIVPITTLAPEPYELLKEIKVVVQKSDDEFVASFFDANVNASGCNETQAVDNLKELLVSRFSYLDTLPKAKLGPAPAKQIAILRTFIKRIA